MFVANKIKMLHLLLEVLCILCISECFIQYLAVTKRN